MKSKVLEKIKGNLSPEEIKKAMIFWQPEKLSAGQMIQLGNFSSKMPFNGTVAFIDLEPTANWGHACKYFLIDENIEKIQKIDAQFPPFADNNTNFLLLSRYGVIPSDEKNFNPF
ncbi:hypothetical protein SAMN04515674_104180 [Pseudarcicella hirudinis]|uniref:Uncharacterized protein n=2 Tax=Pseudarcicella hirudinis TaxID=1079859 RepID=A0A1I5RPX1_9BACT|nr:hypothetical protein SAMN04515674_104180 [Pseudarcicella hirudinis]